MTFEYIEVFYNRKRLHSTLGCKSPMQFLSDWFTAQYEEKLVASNLPAGRRKTGGRLHYKRLVDSWQLYDNSGIPAVLLEEGQNN